RDVLSGAELPPATPVLLALPERHGDAEVDARALSEVIRAELVALAGVQPIFPRGGVTRRGRAGVFAALDRAGELLRRGEHRLALVGAVDSLVDPATVRQLSDRGLLLSRANLDGRIVGEAAGFLLVERPGAAGERAPLAHVVRVA